MKCWEMTKSATILLFVPKEFLQRNCNILDLIASKVEMTDKHSWVECSSMNWERFKLHLCHFVFLIFYFFKRYFYSKNYCF